MALKVEMVTFDCGEPAQLAGWWAEQFGGTTQELIPGEFIAAVLPEGPKLGFQKVPDPTPGKNRVHLDFSVDDVDGEVARLTAAGASEVGGRRISDDFRWIVLADPEGNVFCVLEPREIYQDTGPIAAVVVDCADPRTMARFWSGAMDWAVHEVTDDFAQLRSAQGVGPYLEFLRRPGRRSWRNRLHLDVAPYAGDDQAAEVARLRALGAVDVDLCQGDVPWKVLADVEGNEFCVLTPR
jgi:predicted enzyme related to lactoylglutathione lyase